MLSKKHQSIVLLIALVGQFAGCSSEPSNDGTNNGSTNNQNSQNSRNNQNNQNSENNQQTNNRPANNQPNNVTNNNVAGLGCDPLPAATGTIVNVSPDQADELPQIVQDASTGTTIVLADGTYQFTGNGEGERRLQFYTPGVTLRSESGNPSDVIIDGEYDTNEIFFVGTSDVTIADVTIMRARDHLVHVTGNDSETNNGVRLYNLRLIDSGEQFVKVNSSGQGGYTDNGAIECSFFQLTDAGRPEIERAGNGCYTGGIDTHSGWGWRIANNRFEDIYCAGEGLAEHAVHFWRGARETLVENNTIINCARGIGFGLSAGDSARTYDDDPYPGVGSIEHYDGMIRNNVIYADIPFFDTGIELQNAHGAVVVHNTVVSTDDVTDFYSSIDARWGPTRATIKNNIVIRTTERDLPTTDTSDNLELSDWSIFVDPSNLDFHLTADAAGAIDAGVAVENSGVDLDGESRTDGMPDIGADER